MVTDPVCGMEFKEEDGVAESTYEGETYHFCSKECKHKFDQEPELYAGESEAEEDEEESV
jgi:YHS domain-containing protein